MKKINIYPTSTVGKLMYKDILVASDTNHSNSLITNSYPLFRKGKK